MKSTVSKHKSVIVDFTYRVYGTVFQLLPFFEHLQVIGSWIFGIFHGIQVRLEASTVHLVEIFKEDT